nr:hypothetical protein [Tanacetum cinerariifolium]
VIAIGRRALRLLQLLQHLLGRPQRTGDEPVVDQRGMVTIAFGYLRGGGRITYHSDFEALLDQIAQVRFDAQVGGHAGKNHLRHAFLAQLQGQVVGLRAVHFVRRTDDGLAVENERLE